MRLSRTRRLEVIFTRHSIAALRLVQLILAPYIFLAQTLSGHLRITEHKVQVTRLQRAHSIFGSSLARRLIIGTVETEGIFSTSLDIDVLTAELGSALEVV